MTVLTLRRESRSIPALRVRAGYNSWADANNIVILYPQGGGFQETNQTKYAPTSQIEGGCFDGYGQTGTEYANRDGPQTVTVRNMITAIAGQRYAYPASLQL